MEGAQNYTTNTTVCQFSKAENGVYILPVIFVILVCFHPKVFLKIYGKLKKKLGIKDTQSTEI